MEQRVLADAVAPRRDAVRLRGVVAVEPDDDVVIGVRGARTSDGSGSPSRLRAIPER
jgi:hypothetical protein